MSSPMDFLAWCSHWERAYDVMPSWWWRSGARRRAYAAYAAGWDEARAS